jgi:hypothetical protein
MSRFCISESLGGDWFSFSARFLFKAICSFRELRPNNTDFTSLDDAIAAFEKIMFERAAPLCKETIDGISDFAAPTEKSIQELIKMLS